MSVPQIILASSSPRRESILRDIGIRFIKCPADIDESVLPGEKPDKYVRRMAEAKAKKIANQKKHKTVLGADTIVLIDGRILGKPKNREQALRYITLLSNRTHSVLTSVALARGDQCKSIVARAEVTFRKISKREAILYWETGEPRDKAGGYGIQGVGGIFIDRIEGGHGTVIGLPVLETEKLLRLFNVETWRNRLKE
jgi:septum formation protein